MREQQSAPSPLSTDARDAGPPIPVPYASWEKLPLSEYSTQTWMGIVRLPGVNPVTGRPFLARRLDIKSWPRALWAYALIYFTVSAMYPP